MYVRSSTGSTRCQRIALPSAALRSSMTVWSSLEEREHYYAFIISKANASVSEPSVSLLEKEIVCLSC